MTKTSMLSVAAVFLAGSAIVAMPLAAQQAKSTPGGAVTSFYDLKTMTLDGKPGNLDSTKAR